MTFLLYPLISSSEGQTYPFLISLSSTSVNDHSRTTHKEESHITVPNTKEKDPEKTSWRKKGIKQRALRKIEASTQLRNRKATPEKKKGRMIQKI